MPINVHLGSINSKFRVVNQITHINTTPNPAINEIDGLRIKGCILYLCTNQSAHSVRAKLEGYIDGAWETIFDGTNSNQISVYSYDNTGNGGGSFRISHNIYLFEKKYEKIRVTSSTASVYPRIAVFTFF